jgi:putative endopeptidase
VRPARTIASVVVLLALAGCTAAPAPAPPPAPPASVSGLDLTGFDQSVRPQDDLFRFVNGTWTATTAIPPDRARYGVFDILAERAEADVRAIAEELDAAPDTPGSDEQKIADLYASVLDVATADRLGARPLAAELARIDALTDPSELVGYFGYRTTVGLPSPVGLAVDQDARDATVYALLLQQSGLTLPDRDYYLSEGEPFTTIRNRLGAYVTQLLDLARVPAAADAGSRVVALETRLARAHWTDVQLRDPVATYNKFPVEQAPGLDWDRYLATAQVTDTSAVVIGQPSFFSDLGAAIREVPLEDWKTYLRFTLVDHYAPHLSREFADAEFDFRGRLLQGREVQRERWRQAVTVLDTALGEAVGRHYVGRHFAPAAKQRIDALVVDLTTAFGSSIDQLDWMSDATRAQARDKLARLTTKIGYPDRWKDYAGLDVRRDDPVGNLARSARVEHERATAKLRSAVDRGEWFMTPQTVNAYYNPPMNEIVFPAAILQPPFFNAGADDAVNYGAIGAVIGHEISHAFDDQGSKYDGVGNLRDWWSPQDRQRFVDRTSGLVAQYAAYEPLPGTRVDGELTLGENIADLAGLGIAHEAYRVSLAGAPAPDIDGFSGDQRFFLGWAQGWRSRIRDEALRERLLSDPHSPAEYRVNGVVINLPAFHQAFATTPRDRLFTPPERQIVLW